MSKSPPLSDHDRRRPILFDRIISIVGDWTDDELRRLAHLLEAHRDSTRFTLTHLPCSCPKEPSP